MTNKLIRENVFETNSSSTHSITIDAPDYVSMDVDEEGNIHIPEALQAYMGGQCVI